MPVFDTAGNIVNDAAVEMGLLAANVADPYASTDPNLAQLCRLLKSVGQEIVDERQWSQAIKEHTFTTSAATDYALPADYLAMVDQTGWNRTSSLPLAPLAAQEWQYLKAHSTSLVLTVMFRPWLRRLYIQPSTSTGQLVAFEYRSTYWVQGDGQTTGTATAPTDKDDTILFDRLLVVRGLKLAWKKEKGFDTTSAQADYDRRLEQAMSADAVAPVLNLARRSIGEVLLGPQSIPDTGYGS